MFRSVVLFTFLFSKRNKAASSLRTFSSPMSLDVYATIFFPSKVKFDLLYSNADLYIFDLLCFLGEDIYLYVCLLVRIIALTTYSLVLFTEIYFNVPVNKCFAPLCRKEINVSGTSNRPAPIISREASRPSEEEERNRENERVKVNRIIIFPPCFRQYLVRKCYRNTIPLG